MATDKSKWRIFRKRDPIATYPVQLRPLKGCPCGNSEPCKKRITPKGVTIHYPQKKKKFAKLPASRPYLASKSERGYNNISRPATKVKVIRQRKFPTFKLNKFYR